MVTIYIDIDIDNIDRYIAQTLTICCHHHHHHHHHRHRATTTAIICRLKVGILKDGTVEQFLAANIHRLFMPHGLGHSVGLDVHDPGSLSPFAAGMVVTCEPGIYFYPSLLVPAFSNPEQGKYLNQPLIQDTYMKMGGFRLEDTVLITAGAPDNLSVGAPRTAAEIEAFMAKGASVGAGNRGASFTARGEQPEGVHTAVEQAQE